MPLTRTFGWARAPGNVLVRTKDTGLRHASVANVSQLTVSDRRRLLEKAGAVSASAMKQIEEGLKLILGI